MLIFFKLTFFWEIFWGAGDDYIFYFINPKRIQGACFSHFYETFSFEIIWDLPKSRKDRVEFLHPLLSFFKVLFTKLLTLWLSPVSYEHPFPAPGSNPQGHVASGCYGGYDSSPLCPWQWWLGHFRHLRSEARHSSHCFLLECVALKLLITDDVNLSIWFRWYLSVFSTISYYFPFLQKVC